MSISPFPLENITSRQKLLRKGFGREPHPRLAYLEREEKRMQDDRPQACPPRDAEGLEVSRPGIEGDRGNDGKRDCLQAERPGPERPHISPKSVVDVLPKQQGENVPDPWSESTANRSRSGTRHRPLEGAVVRSPAMPGSSPVPLVRERSYTGSWVAATSRGSL